MKIYIAGPYELRERAIALMQSLEARGFEVTSTWLRERENDATHEDRRRAADLDIADVRRADVLVAWTRHCGAKEPRGTLFEAGIAVGEGKPVLWVGDIAAPHTWWKRHECIFYDATVVTRVLDFGSLYGVLEQIRRGL